MDENKIIQDKIENKKKVNKLLPIVIICCLVLTAGFIIFIFIKNNATLTSDKAKIILKEKNEIYKKIIKPEPYCGDNASRTTDEINSDEKIVLYWNVSTQFKSYEQLLNFVSENITENQIQELKSNKSYTTFRENLYLEKDNKLYCGVVGAGSVNPNNTTYEIIEYSENKIVGTATDIYGAEDVEIGLTNNVQYKYNITLIKENGLWKIDEYEINNNTIYFYSNNNEYKYTKKYEEIEDKNSIISRYNCNSNCEINMPSLAFIYNNADSSKVMIYEANENILYDIKQGVIGRYGTEARWLYSNDDEYMNGTYIYIKSKENNKYGIIDKNGKVIKDFILEKTNGIYSNNAEMLKSSYSVENNLIVDSQNNKYGIVKITEDEIIIDYLYEDIELLNEKYFKVKESNMWYLYSFETKDKSKEKGYIDLMIVNDILFSISDDNKLYIENGNNNIKQNINSKYKYLLLGNDSNNDNIVFFISEFRDLSQGSSIKYKYSINDNIIVQE